MTTKKNDAPATIEKCAKALFEHEMFERGVSASWDNVDDEDRPGWRASAAAVLRAAGVQVTPRLTIPSGCKITGVSPTEAMIEAAERQGYTPYSAREVWIAMHAEAPLIRAYGLEREGVCSCMPGANGDPLGGACEPCTSRLAAMASRTTQGQPA